MPKILMDSSTEEMRKQRREKEKQNSKLKSKSNTEAPEKKTLRNSEK